MRGTLSLLLLPVVLAVPGAVTKRDTPAPLLVPRGDGELIADSFIVKLKDESALSALDDSLGLLSDNATHVYDSVFRGFAGKLDKATLKALRDHPDVDYIEQDGVVKASGYVVQPNSGWGLARISHKMPGNTKYIYDDTAGEGTCSYVLDTGISTTEPEFEGRAVNLISFFSSQPTDGHGHGTHLAGIIGSKTYGVAKKTKLFGIKVLDNSGSGSVSNVIAGMNFVIKDAAQRCPKRSVANLSFSGSYSVAVNQAAAALVTADVFASAAAGGSATGVGNTSPASEPLVCTAASSTANDVMSSFSNYGPLIDIFAPGQGIRSTWLGGTTNTLSGTSMSAAYITGLGAYIIAWENTYGLALCPRIQQLATQNALINLPAGTPNLLAYNGNPFG